MNDSITPPSLKDSIDQEISDKKHATVLLISGDLDKAITAFEVAIGFAAMGIKVEMWFIFYGVNSIKKPVSLWQRTLKLFKKGCISPGRIPETDGLLQRIIPFLNSSSNASLPLSQLNYFGIGPLLVNHVLKHKRSPSLSRLVEEAVKLGITFSICQPCVDILMLDVEKDLIVDAKIRGVSTYTMNVTRSHYNGVY